MALLNVNEQDKVKVLVLGDTGVGKTCLVHLLCAGEVLSYSAWTAGVNVDVLLFEHPLTKKKHFVEFWDVGGSTRYELARSVFYNDAHGAILVHDLSNKKSRQNLKKWIKELALQIDPNSSYSWSKIVSGPEDGDGVSASPIIELSSNDNGNVRSLPVLVIGNKADLVSHDLHGRSERPGKGGGYDYESGQSSSSVEDGDLQIQLSAQDERSVAPGSLPFNTLRSFYQTVIDRNRREDWSQQSLNRKTTSLAASSVGSNRSYVRGSDNPLLSVKVGGDSLL